MDKDHCLRVEKMFKESLSCGSENCAEMPDVIIFCNEEKYRRGSWKRA